MQEYNIQEETTTSIEELEEQRNILSTSNADDIINNPHQNIDDSMAILLDAANDHNVSTDPTTPPTSATAGSGEPPKNDNHINYLNSKPLYYIKISKESKSPIPINFIENLDQSNIYGYGCPYYAVKKIENTFENLSFAKRTLRELKILRSLNHENVLKIHKVYISESKNYFQDIYVITDLMETDLSNLIRSGVDLLPEHVQFILFQLVKGVSYIHSVGVVHRDLKPRNIIVNSSCDIKICDFGLARLRYKQDSTSWCAVTEYICTRWYRAPEVLCAWTEYGPPMDVWSVGCILGEMLLRKALFTGRNTQNQLKLIVNTIGAPSENDIARIPNDKCRKFLRAISRMKPPRKYGDIFTFNGDITENGTAAFLEATLQFNPDRRLPAEKLLELFYFGHLVDDVEDAIDTSLPIRPHTKEWDEHIINRQHAYAREVEAILMRTVLKQQQLQLPPSSSESMSDTESEASKGLRRSSLLASAEAASIFDNETVVHEVHRLPMHEFEFERRKITLNALREELWKEMLFYYPALAKNYYNSIISQGHSIYNIYDFRLLEAGEAQFSDDGSDDD